MGLITALRSFKKKFRKITKSLKTPLPPPYNPYENHTIPPENAQLLGAPYTLPGAAPEHQISDADVSTAPARTSSQTQTARGEFDADDLTEQEELAYLGTMRMRPLSRSAHSIRAQLGRMRVSPNRVYLDLEAKTCHGLPLLVVSPAQGPTRKHQWWEDPAEKTDHRAVNGQVLPNTVRMHPSDVAEDQASTLSHVTTTKAVSGHTLPVARPRLSRRSRPASSPAPTKWPCRENYKLDIESPVGHQATVKPIGFTRITKAVERGQKNAAISSETKTSPTATNEVHCVPTKLLKVTIARQDKGVVQVTAEQTSADTKATIVAESPVLCRVVAPVFILSETAAYSKPPIAAINPLSAVALRAPRDRIDCMTIFKPGNIVKKPISVAKGSNPKRLRIPMTRKRFVKPQKLREGADAIPQSPVNTKTSNDDKRLFIPGDDSSSVGRNTTVAAAGFPDSTILQAASCLRSTLDTTKSLHDVTESAVAVLAAGVPIGETALVEQEHVQRKPLMSAKGQQPAAIPVPPRKARFVKAPVVATATAQIEPARTVMIDPMTGCCVKYERL